MKLAETCVKYPVFTVMLIAFLVTLGVFSYRGLAVDLFPKADPATVNVEVRLPGATPEELVTGVVLPLEDAISSVSGIDEINVWSFEGFADITCTFVLERDIEGAAQDIREKVAGAIDRLPRDTLPPIITKQDPQSDPIMTLLVSGPMSRRELTEIADKQIRRAIQTVDGVGSVDLNGGQGRQVRVLLDAQKLTAHNFHGSRCALGFAARKHRSARRTHDHLAPRNWDSVRSGASLRRSNSARSSSVRAAARPCASAMWHKSKTAPRNCARGRRYFARTFPARTSFPFKFSVNRESTLCASRTTCEASSMICVPSFRPACNFRWSTIFPISSRLRYIRSSNI